MKVILPNIISENQIMFFLRRLSTNNIMIVYEVRRYLKNMSKGKNVIAAKKLDISKAYNRIEWNIKMVMNCVSMVSYKVAYIKEQLGMIWTFTLL